MNKFNEINHKPLRIFNRCVMLFNIKEDAGQAAVENYINSFTTDERIEMMQMIALTRKLGEKRVRQLVTQGCKFTDDNCVMEAA